MAEGVVIRSFYYWLLTCIFGDVPFYTKEVADQQVMQEIAHMGRMSAKETRDYLIDELQRYVPSMDQVRSSEVADNRMGAAMGWMMIAKLAQWNHRWDDALKALGELEKIYGDLQQYPLEDIMFRNKNTRSRSSRCSAPTRPADCPSRPTWQPSPLRTTTARASTTAWRFPKWARA